MDLVRFVAVNSVALCGLQTFVCVADDMLDFYGDEEFVSIATGTAKNLSRLPAAAEVITADQMRMRGANTLFEILETVTGVHVYPSAPGRAYPMLSIRGIHTGSNAQNLILLNGVRTTEIFTGGAFNLLDLGVEMIERIEIIKGPGSAVYGADAFAGVINVVTKSHTDGQTLDVGAKAGSFGTQTAWLNHWYSNGEFRLNISGHWRQIDGDNQRIIAEDGLSAIGLSSISLAPSALDTRRRHSTLSIKAEYSGWFASVFYQNSLGGVGAGATQVLSDDGDIKTDINIVSLGYEWQSAAGLASTLKATLTTNKVKAQGQIFPDGFIQPSQFDPQTGSPIAFTLFPEGVFFTPGYDEETAGIEYVGVQQLTPDHRLRFNIGGYHSSVDATESRNFGPGVLDGSEQVVGADLTDVTDTPFIFLQPQQRNMYFGSLQDEWAISSDLELTAGLRFDHFSDVGSTTNPRLALVWQAAYDLTIKALYGKAFRAPSFRELNNMNNPISLGSPDLSPERLTSSELVFDYRLSFDTQVQANFFVLNAEDLIKLTNIEENIARATNSEEIRSRGMEAKLTHRIFEDVAIKLGFALHDAEFRESNTPVADAPRQSWDLSADWQINESTKLYWDIRWLSNRPRLADDPRRPLGGLRWSNLAIDHQVNNNLTINFMIRNLLNQRQFEPSDIRIPGDYPLERRGFWLSLAYRPG